MRACVYNVDEMHSLIHSEINFKNQFSIPFNPFMLSDHLIAIIWHVRFSLFIVLGCHCRSVCAWRKSTVPVWRMGEDYLLLMSRRFCVSGHSSVVTESHLTYRTTSATSQQLYRHDSLYIRDLRHRLVNMSESNVEKEKTAGFAAVFCMGMWVSFPCRTNYFSLTINLIFHIRRHGYSVCWIGVRLESR